MEQGASRRQMLKAGGTALVGLASSTAGCLSLVNGGGKTFVVSSKNFTEQFILSNISIVLLKEAGHDVESKTGLGGSPANVKALRNDESDLYWEYTGTAWSSILGQENQISDPQKLYGKVDHEYNQRYKIDWLKYAPFNNTYVIMVNPSWAKERGLKTLKDLGAYVRAGHTDFSVAMNPEIQKREDAWAGLPEAYNFAKKADQISTENMKLGLAYKAVKTGQVELGFGFNTNPKIQKYGLRVLKDVKNFFIIYNPAPNVSTQELTDSVKETLNEPTKDLTTETQRKLNMKVATKGKEPKTVARNFLQRNGYV